MAVTMGMTYSDNGDDCSETLVSLPILGCLPQFFQKPWRWSSFPSRCSRPDLLDLYPYIFTTLSTHSLPPCCFILLFFYWGPPWPQHLSIPGLSAFIDLISWGCSSCTPIGMIKTSSRSVTSLTSMNSHSNGYSLSSDLLSMVHDSKCPSTHPFIHHSSIHASWSPFVLLCTLNLWSC